MGHYDSIEMSNALSEFKGDKVKEIITNTSADEGFLIVFESGKTIEAGWSGGYGGAVVNGKSV